jgi:hypothetical protein
MKKTWVRKTLSVGILAAGALLLAPAAMAQADVDQTSFGNFGTLNGNQVAIPVTVPVNVVGNSLGILGSAQSFGIGANHVESGRSGGTRQTSGHNKGLLNGNQVSVPVTIPVNVAGNAAALAGKSSATGFAANRVESGKAESGLLGGLGGLGGFGGGVSQVSFGNFGTLNGNQIAMPISIPVNACGNSLALIGAASSAGTCSNHIGGGFGYARQAVQAVQAVEVPVRKQFVRSDNYSSCSAYVVASPCGGGSSYGYADSYDYGVDQVSYGNYGTYNATQYAEPVAIPVDACGNSLGMLGYASAYGACGNYVDTDVVYTQSVQYVEPIVPVYTTPAYVIGGADCVRICGDNSNYGYAGDVRGDQGGYGNGGVRGDKGGYRAHKGHKANKGDVRGDQGYGDKGDVRGDQGYGNKGDVRGDQGYSDLQDDNAGYAQGGARDDEFPAADDAGYVSPDQYGTRVGGRNAEKFSPTGLTRGLSGLGTLDLLGGLR